MDLTVTFTAVATQNWAASPQERMGIIEGIKTIEA
jgi:hypothetical protein